MTEVMRISLTQPEDHCGFCTRDVQDEQHLDLELSDGRDVYEVAVCRACLSEHMPGLLAQIEEAVDG